jgi:putative glycosyltransferase (TIGR04372 family)
MAAAILVGNTRVIMKSQLIIENSNLTKTLFRGSTGKLDMQLRLLSHAYKLDHEGHYYQAAHLRGELLENIYDDAKVGSEYFPPLFGGRWTSYIGHLCVLALHSKAQELELVPKGKRLMITTGSVANQKLCDLLGNNYVQLTDSYLANLEFFPPTQLLFENYHSIKTRIGFLETHKFIEEVFKENAIKNPGKSIISREMVDVSIDLESKKTLLSMLNKPFVAVHLRNTGNYERRDVFPESYFEAFRVLAEKGYLIVNIGPRVDSIIGAEIINISDRNFHPYIMMKAEFAITTTSGPSLLPSLVGTPNLVTNLTSIGRNMIHCNQTTFYMPKHVIQHGKKMRFKEILNHDIAFDEREPSELAPDGITFEGNSSMEIMDAVNWMIDAIDKADFASDDVDSRVSSIRKIQNVLSCGRLIPTFFHSNLEYLD